jgi:hypothetical protein
MSPETPLNLLLTTHHLVFDQGTELFTFTIADHLRRLGHRVAVYSPYLGPTAGRFAALGVPVTDDLQSLAGERFDLAHVHHTINALELRNCFPTLPMLYVSHGVPRIEVPPPLDLHIGAYLATSERVMGNLIHSGVPADQISLFRNPVDRQRFYPGEPIHHRPQKALLLSNNIDRDSRSIIHQACDRMGIELTLAGALGKPIVYEEIPQEIWQVDVVFSLGRGVIEAMLCGRVPVVMGAEGSDGMVTPENMANLMRANYSGNVLKLRYTVDGLMEALKCYRPELGMELCRAATPIYAADLQTKRLESIYRQVIAAPPAPLTEAERRQVDYMVAIVHEGRQYAAAAVVRRAGAEFDALNGRLAEIERSRLWRLLLRLRRVREIYFPPGSRRGRLFDGLSSVLGLD